MCGLFYIQLPLYLHYIVWIINQTSCTRNLLELIVFNHSSGGLHAYGPAVRIGGSA
jgi:hypothetical protein